MKKLSKDIYTKLRAADSVLFRVSDDDHVIVLDRKLKMLPDFLKVPRTLAEVTAFINTDSINEVTDLLGRLEKLGIFEGAMASAPVSDLLLSENYSFGSLRVMNFEDFLPSKTTEVFAFNCVCNCCGYCDNCTCSDC